MRGKFREHTPWICFEYFQGTDMPKLLRFPAVQAKTGGLCRTTIWYLEKKGLFPKRRNIGTKIVVWDEDEIDDWVRSRNEGSGSLPDTRKADGAPKWPL